MPERQVAFVDLDDTMYPGLIMEDLVAKQIEDGLLRPKNTKSLLREIEKYKSGEKGQASNVKLLNMWWAWACRGIGYADLANQAQEFVRQHKDNFTTFTQPVLSLLRTRRYHIWLVTGEPTFVAQAVADNFGLTGFCATEWVTKIGNGGPVIEGSINKPVNNERKARWTDHLFAGHLTDETYTRDGSLALVDSPNDIGLIEAAQHSIVCGNPNQQLLRYLEISGRSFVIASAERVVGFVDRLTAPRGRQRLPDKQYPGHLVYR